MTQPGLKPTTRALEAAERTWTHLGPDYPVAQRLERSVEAAFAQHTVDQGTTWRGIVALAIIAGTFLATVWLFRH